MTLLTYVGASAETKGDVSTSLSVGLGVVMGLCSGFSSSPSTSGICMELMVFGISVVDFICL